MFDLVGWGKSLNLFGKEATAITKGVKNGCS